MSYRRHRAKLGVGAIVFVFLFSLVNQLTAAEKIRVGAWNLETLGSPQSRDYRKQRDGHGFGVRRNPADLFHQLERLNLDVLALAEIDDTTLGDDNRNNDVLDRVFQLLNRTTKNDWTYVLFPKYSHYADTQLTGLAWNRAKVNQSGDWYRVELGVRTSRYYEWDRHPHAMKFTRGEGRTDFIVIPIHMKAGRSEKAIDQRRVEATALTARLGHIGDHFDDKDVILIGDFNMTHASEPAGEVFKRAGAFRSQCLKPGDTFVESTARPRLRGAQPYVRGRTTNLDCRTRPFTSNELSASVF